jgi:hypothetical protein
MSYNFYRAFIKVNYKLALLVLRNDSIIPPFHEETKKFPKYIKEDLLQVSITCHNNQPNFRRPTPITNHFN